MSDAWKIIGFLLVAAASIYYVKAKTEIEQSWPRTQAIVTGMKVTSSKNRRDRYEYTATLLYRYEANGTHHSAVDLSTPFSRESSAEDAARRYPVGTKLEIAYDPERPDRSHVVQPGFSSAIQL
ncbi:DUF3592 domain-containing protein [Pseudomonas sp. TUM22785]|uniref:DUF3592 domain-containing protein n=1 Tax=Pseudomonas sp. TUM22785 TaxID=3019098 RepID=UPI0023052748|nr:DUF3592 domain-containing protein [Pseudomonas sp. TUM22785]WCD81245.1 DUF3592 domain-containing protein [Pseudomonas sp. TUM22785]